MLECSKADTGVGPSMAEGSHGWRPNWADLPAAASRRPKSGIFRLLWSAIKICWRSHVFRFVRNHAMAMMRPTSPMRL